MKKTIAILLVAIMAVGSVFATFSGEASIGFGGNLDNGNFGFIDTGAKVKVDFDLSTASVDTTPTETVAEDGTVTPAPSIYAAVKGSLGVKLFTGEENVDEIEDPGSGLLNGAKLSVIADITEATIGGQNWSVSILEVAGAPNYAKGFQTYTVEDGYDKWDYERADFTENYNTELAFEKAPGITATVYGYKVGFGMLGDYASGDWKLKDNLNMSVMFETPAYDFGVEGLSLQAGTAYSYKTFKELNDDGVPVYGDKTDLDGDSMKVGEEVQKKTAGEFSRTNQWNISAKAGYATDLFSVALATDMGIKLGSDPKFDADVTLDATYDFLTVNAYYGTNPVTGKTPKKVVDADNDGILDTDDKGKVKYGDNKPDAYWKETSKDMLSAQVKVDLNSFEIPVAVTLGMNDILAKQAMSASVEVTPIEGLKLTVNGGYTINDEGRKENVTDGKLSKKDAGGVWRDYQMVIDKDAAKVGKWSAGMSGEYSFAYGKVTAGLSLEQKLDANKNLIVGANAAFENSTLIPGATLKFAWADAKDMLGKDTDKTDFGKITASVSMTF